MTIFFDVHHHFQGRENGIYNPDLGENLTGDYFSVGLHPNRINENWERNLEQIKVLSKDKNCLAIGECGLDALVEVDENLQEKVFEQQILWANEIQKPVMVHCVRRFSQLLRFQKMAKVPLIIHGFNKKKEIAEELIDKGFYLSFGKAFLYNENLQEIVKNLPLERIFLETDTAEMEIEKVYHKLSEIKNIDLQDIGNQIQCNIEKVFKIKV